MGSVRSIQTPKPDAKGGLHPMQCHEWPYPPSSHSALQGGSTKLSPVLQLREPSISAVFTPRPTEAHRALPVPCFGDIAHLGSPRLLSSLTLQPQGWLDASNNRARSRHVPQTYRFIVHPSQLPNQKFDHINVVLKARTTGVEASSNLHRLQYAPWSYQLSIDDVDYRGYMSQPGASLKLQSAQTLKVLSDLQPEASADIIVTLEPFPHESAVSLELESIELLFFEGAKDDRGHFFIEPTHVPHVPSAHGYKMFSHHQDTDGWLSVEYSSRTAEEIKGPAALQPTRHTHFGTAKNVSLHQQNIERAQVDTFWYTKLFHERWFTQLPQFASLDLEQDDLQYRMVVTDNAGSVHYHGDFKHIRINIENAHPDGIIHELVHKIALLFGVPSRINAQHHSFEHIGSVLHEGFADILSPIIQGYLYTQSKLSGQSLPIAFPDWKIDVNVKGKNYARDFSRVPSKYQTMDKVSQLWSWVWQKSSITPHRESGWLRHWFHLMVTDPKVQRLFKQRDTQQDYVFFTIASVFIVDMLKQCGLLFKKHPNLHYHDLSAHLNNWLNQSQDETVHKLPAYADYETYETIRKAAARAWRRIKI